MPKDNKMKNVELPLQSGSKEMPNIQKNSINCCVICGKEITSLHYSTDDGPLCGEFPCHKEYSRLKTAGKSPITKDK